MDTLEKPTYEKDFVLWLEHQAELLRQGRVAELDLENLAEEVESIGRSDKREVQNRLTTLLVHLLKYQYQAEQRSRSWLSTIAEQRRQLELVFKDSPSLLKSYAPTVLEDSYRYARRRASGETQLNTDIFPETSPYTINQILDEDFLPEATHG
jgi:hypothetical protein